jgi:hypothetical protein
MGQFFVPSDANYGNNYASNQNQRSSDDENVK